MARATLPGMKKQRDLKIFQELCVLLPLAHDLNIFIRELCGNKNQFEEVKQESELPGFTLQTAVYNKLHNQSR